MPFDTGGSDSINDGVVHTRYALGITGAPLTASTRYALVRWAFSGKAVSYIPLEWLTS